MTFVPNTEPYPWPWDGADQQEFDPARCAVVVAGAQRHWLDTVVEPADFATISWFVDQLRDRGVLVVWIRHGAIAGAGRPVDRVLPAVGSPGWELLVPPADSDLLIDTPGLDGFASLPLELELRSRHIDRLFMVGVGTETVVSSTCRSANDRGFECLTVTDAGLHHDPVVGAASLSSVCMSGGIFGAIGVTADVLSVVPTR